MSTLLKDYFIIYLQIGLFARSIIEFGLTLWIIIK